MRTIRKGTFESNSSSSHTITIGTDLDEPSNALVVKGRLYPDNLPRLETHMYSDTSIIHARTKDEKAAWVAQVIHGSSHDIEVTESNREVLMSVLADGCGYDGIESPTHYRSGMDDYSGVGLNLDTDYHEECNFAVTVNTLHEFIRDVVLVDGVAIRDVYSTN